MSKIIIALLVASGPVMTMSPNVMARTLAVDDVKPVDSQKSADQVKKEAEEAKKKEARREELYKSISKRTLDEKAQNDKEKAEYTKELKRKIELNAQREKENKAAIDKLNAIEKNIINDDGNSTHESLVPLVGAIRDLGRLPIDQLVQQKTALEALKTAYKDKKQARLMTEIDLRLATIEAYHELKGDDKKAFVDPNALEKLPSDEEQKATMAKFDLTSARVDAMISVLGSLKESTEGALRCFISTDLKAQFTLTSNAAIGNLQKELDDRESEKKILDEKIAKRTEKILKLKSKIDLTKDEDADLKATTEAQTKDEARRDALKKEIKETSDKMKEVQELAMMYDICVGTDIKVSNREDSGKSGTDAEIKAEVKKELGTGSAESANKK